MKAVVTYTSQTGFTKQYAQWIAEAAGADCLDLAEAKKRSLDAYDAIVFGSWACAGSISKLGWFRKRLDSWAGKKLIMFCVGASPADSLEVKKALESCLTPAEREKVHVFYCPGGLRYDRMRPASRAAMRLFARAIQGKRNKTPEEEEMARAISSSYDLSDRRHIEPILACLRS